MEMPMRKRELLVLAAALMSLACYSYSSTELTDVSPGTLVRARITSDQAARVEEVVGRESNVLDGVLVSSTPDTMLIEVPAAARVVTGGVIQVLHQRVSVPRAGVTEVELKRLNRGRTSILFAVGIAALGYVALDAFNIGPGKETGPTQPGGDDFHIPLLRIR